jgi:hypothetical protein
VSQFQYCLDRKSNKSLRRISGKISLKEYNTRDKTILDEWGISDGLFIDGKEINTGPAPSYKKLMKKINNRAKKINQPLH